MSVKCYKGGESTLNEMKVGSLLLYRLAPFALDIAAPKRIRDVFREKGAFQLRIYVYINIEARFGDRQVYATESAGI